MPPTVFANFPILFEIKSVTVWSEQRERSEDIAGAKSKYVGIYFQIFADFTLSESTLQILETRNINHSALMNAGRVLF